MKYFFNSYTTNGYLKCGNNTTLFSGNGIFETVWLKNERSWKNKKGFSVNQNPLFIVPSFFLLMNKP